MYEDIEISNVFNLNEHFFFFFSFLQHLLVAIAANCENSSESKKFLVTKRDTVCYKPVVSD